MWEYISEIINGFLTNEIVKVWIAPIVTGLLVVAIPVFITRFFRTKARLKNISEVNEKIISAIRPYIIQQISIKPELITDIRTSIVQESQLRDKEIYNEKEIRNKLLVDISETRFLKENEKQNLIEFTYKTFEKFNQNTVDTECEKERNNKFKVLNSILLIVSLVVMLIGYIFSPEELPLEENIVVIIAMISTMVGIVNLYFELLFGKIYDINKYKSRIELLRTNLLLKIEKKNDK